jgi:D-xylonolactonase
MTDLSEPHVIAAVGALLGEGPVWDPRDASLWWVDIKAPRIWRWRDGATDSFLPPCPVSALAPAADGGFVGAGALGFLRLDPAAGRYRTIGSPEAERPAMRFNDGKLDRAGRFWAGTMDDAERDAVGALYRLDPDHRWQRMDGPYLVPNGPAFSPDGRIMYHSDSARRRLYAFDLAADGVPANRQLLAEFAADQGYPDGMTVDAEGMLWIAFWDGGCLRRLAPDGRIELELALPVSRPTSCAFGGPGLDRLFVTSARIGLDAAAGAMQPLAGALFMIETTVRGLPDRPFGEGG